MSSKWKLITAVMMLCLIGGGVAVYKVSSLGVPFWPGEQVYDWQVEARVTFFATGRRVKARLALPRANVTDRRGRESGSLGYHYNIETERGGQTAVWAAENRDGKQSLYYWVRFPGAGTSAADRVAAESAEPSSVGLGGAVGDAFVVIVDELRRVTTDPDALFVAVFQRINQESGSQEFTLVKRYYEEEFGDDAMLRMGIDMLESSGVRARKAYGVSLDEELGAQDPIPLIEYCDGAYWRVRDPR
ncbi:MAG: UUP1 family membrane protein, partial [Verrucomicrobiales bacterium]